MHSRSRQAAWAERLAASRARGVAERLVRLLAVRRSARHPGAARPRRAADRHRLRQRPDGDRRYAAAAQERGLHVPDDLSVTGFDDTAISGYLRPPSRRSAPTPSAGGGPRPSACCELVDGGPIADVLLPPPELVLRGSTAPPRPTTRNGSRMNIKKTTTLGLSLMFALASQPVEATAAGGGGGGEHGRDRTHQDLAVEQPRGDRLGREDGRRLEHGAPRREGHRAGDPGRQVLRGGHRRGDHRRQRALPDLQHLAGVPSRSSRSRAAWSPSTTSPTASELHRGAHRRRVPSSTSRRTASTTRCPWKSNPVMIFYNKDIFKKAGLDPENPPLATYDEFLRHQREDRVAAVPPRPRSSRRRLSEFFQSWFDFYPLFAAETGGKPARSRTTRRTFDNHRRARPVADFWQHDLRRGALAGTRSTTVTPSPTARPPWRSSGPGRSRSTQGQSTGASAPVPTSGGHVARGDLHVQRREEHRPSTPPARTAGHGLGFHRSSPPAPSRTASCWR